MTNHYLHQCEQIIDAILETLPKNDPQIRAFAECFYKSLSLADLQDVPLPIAGNMAQLAYEACTSFTGDAPHITISTPHMMRDHYGRNRLVVIILNKDKPFLVDSLSMAFVRLGFTIYRIIHPQLFVQRDNAGTLQTIHATKEQGVQAESCMYVELSPLPAGLEAEKLREELLLTLSYVQHAVGDWRIMLAKLREVGTHIVSSAPQLPTEELQEASDFLDWLLENNFIFLGYAEYDFYDASGAEKLIPRSESALGIFKIPQAELLQRGLASLPPEVRYFAEHSTPLEITKSNRRSVVHRDVLMDYIGIKRYDASGKVIGESRFIGLFTSAVYYQQTTAIPYIRRKVSHVMEMAAYDKSGHSGKALKAALEFFPRDELFQIAEDELLAISLGIVSLEERPDMRVFLRYDRFERFVTCFVYMPRDKFNTYVRQEIAHVLEQALDGTLDVFYSQLTDSALARVIYVIRTTPAHIPAVDMDALNEKLRFIVNYWVDSLREALQDGQGEQHGERVFQKFSTAFPRHYINTTAINEALVDIAAIEKVLSTQRAHFRLFTKGKHHSWHLKMISLGAEANLSDVLPLLENMGVQVRDVVPHRIQVQVDAQTRTTVLMRDFSVHLPDIAHTTLHHSTEQVEAMLGHVWMGEAENDRLNALSTTAGLEKRQIMLLRAYVRYAVQAELGYGQDYIAQVLCDHATVTKLLVALFTARFAPETPKKREERVQLAHASIIDALGTISNLAEDKILRFVTETIQATLRTNYFQVDADGAPKPYISLKFDSAKVPNLPKPVPLREIFVYSPTTEGIHLRGGKVARGGLRWSDRHADFRTEVLGLVKAQMVKNTVIVPTGSKGGFITKAKVDAADAQGKLQAGIAAYREFLQGLLDITDNRHVSEIIQPERVVRYDEDDPYLVVAADKGTATFSDIANGVARDYSFWLDDAFASGGSVGYDHKKMAITARGAWISVQRHFSEMGRDIEQTPFTVVGIGDMSGDVFGNGMILSDKIKLLAAFNHLHIFLDPDPDPAISFAERKRLFEKARGSWDEYDSSLISQGGGVFLRSAKTIPLSPHMQAMLGTQARELAPNEVIKLILMADVDLLWNGGIGTYVKSSLEAHSAAGDPSNNALRIDGTMLRCKIIGEGGNLGLTQRGRVEYARLGGRINTDAIDNSAGVDCSDHEVNIKIAFGSMMAAGQLTLDARNQLLAEMTEEVAALVLRDNYLQNLALTIAERRAAYNIELHTQFIRDLERRGVMERAVEYLPTDKQLGDLKAEKGGLSRPELAVLLAYSKIDLYAVLSHSKLVEDAIYAPLLLSYFPKAMQERYRDALLSHPLKVELVATLLTNEIVNRAGLTYIYSIHQDTGHEICNIVRAFTAVKEIFGLEQLWQSIEALDKGETSSMVVELFTHTARFLKRMSIWFLNNTPQPLDLQQVISTYSTRIAAYRTHMHAFVSGTAHEWRMQAKAEWMEKGIPASLAEEIVSLEGMISACDIAMLDDNSPHTLVTIGKVYYTIGVTLQLSWMRVFLREFPAEHHWDRLAVANAVSELYEQQRRLTQNVLEILPHDTDNIEDTLHKWQADHAHSIERFEHLIYALKSQARRDMAMVMVALRQLAAIKG
jgi:glutamate dehydrogenase